MRTTSQAEAGRKKADISGGTHQLLRSPETILAVLWVSLNLSFFTCKGGVPPTSPSWKTDQVLTNTKQPYGCSLGLVYTQLVQTPGAQASPATGEQVQVTKPCPGMLAGASVDVGGSNVSPRPSPSTPILTGAYQLSKFKKKQSGLL